MLQVRGSPLGNRAPGAQKSQELAEILERPQRPPHKWDRRGGRRRDRQGNLVEITGTKRPPDDIWFTLKSEGAGYNNNRNRVIILEMLVMGHDR